MPVGDLTDWLGNSEERHDQIVAFPANALSATLNHDTQYVEVHLCHPFGIGCISYRFIDLIRQIMMVMQRLVGFCHL